MYNAIQTYKDTWSNPSDEINPETTVASEQTKSDRPYIEQLVQKYENRIFRTALAIMGNHADAEDVMQDVFLKIIENPPQFESDEHEEAWLVRVTVNRCKSELRLFWRKKKQPLSEIYSSGDSHSPLDNPILESVNTLPPKYRIAIYLFYYEGYSTKEIAEITKQKETTVRSQLARARAQLKEILEEEGL